MFSGGQLIKYGDKKIEENDQKLDNIIAIIHDGDKIVNDINLTLD